MMERDAVVATILESVEQELSSHDIDFDATQSVAGSALLALTNDASSIGVASIERLVKS